MTTPNAKRSRLDEFFRAASETSESIRQSPTVTNGKRNAFVTRHGLDLFEYYKQDPKRAARFASAMAGVSRRQLQPIQFRVFH
jgi:hypothetical protein